jgi:hypothetical protein
VDGDAVHLRDLGSSNGTFCNGERVQETALSAGDQVDVGPVQFRVILNGQPDPDSIEVGPAAGGAGVGAGDQASSSEISHGSGLPTEGVLSGGSVDIDMSAKPDPEAGVLAEASSAGDDAADPLAAVMAALDDDDAEDNSAAGVAADDASDSTGSSDASASGDPEDSSVFAFSLEDDDDDADNGPVIELLDDDDAKS